MLGVEGVGQQGEQGDAHLLLPVLLVLDLVGTKVIERCDDSHHMKKASIFVPG